MDPKLQVQVKSFTRVEETEGAWTSEDYLTLLKNMDFGDASGLADGELREMCVLSLQDREPADAAALLLQYRMRDKLTAGQIQNMSNEMLDEKLWEEYADMAMHETLFYVGSLLYAAFPAQVPTTDAVRVKLDVLAQNESAKVVLEAGIVESFLVRLLADGMDQSSVLHRLFDEQLSGNSFPEADKIVWVYSTRPSESGTSIDILSSGYWIEALEGVDAYVSTARPDLVPSRL